MATENSSFFPNQKALSQEFNYTPKRSSVNGRSFRVSVPATNQSTTGFTQGDTIQFAIPCGRRNTFLDPQSSYLRYTVRATNTVSGANTATSAALSSYTIAGNTAVQNTYGAGVFLDHDCFSVFNRTTLYSGSNMLENVQNVNVLYNYLLDTNFSYANAISDSLNYGLWLPESGNINEIRRGTFLSSVTSTVGTATASTTSFINEAQTFCVPIVSGLIGIGSPNKCVPIYAINDVLRLEMLCEQNARACVQLGALANGTIGYTIINAELELQFIELDDMGMSLVNQTAPSSSPIYIVGNSFRNNQQNIPNGTNGSFSCLVPSKLGSLRSLHCIFRRNTELASSTSYSLSSRVNPLIEYYSLKVSGTQFPQKPVFLKNSNNTAGYAESLVELKKVFSSLLSTDKAGLLTSVNYNVATSADASSGVNAVSTGLSSYLNAFAIAFDLELFNGSEVIVKGLNCLSESMYLELSLSGATTENINIDFFASFDNIFIIDQTGYVSSRA